MSNEIATYSMILSKLSLGKSGTECPTKTQILAINSLIVIDNASTYGANECVKIDDIRKKAETWNYYLTVSPTSMSFGAGGGSKSFTVSSYKRKVLDGVEQSGNTSVSLKSTTISGTGFSLSGTTVSASANEITSNRTGTVTITQNESGLKCYIVINQSGYTPTYTFNVIPTNLGVTAAETNETLTVESYKTVLKSDGSETTESLDYEFSSNRDWVAAVRTTTNTTHIYVAQNSTTAQRSARITLTQEESGIQAFTNVIQAGATPDDYLSIINSSISTTAEYTYINFKSSQPWSFSLDSVDIDNPVVIDKTSGSAGDNLTVALTYWKQYSRPRYIPYTIKQTAGQKLQAAGHVSFN